MGPYQYLWFFKEHYLVYKSISKRILGNIRLRSAFIKEMALVWLREFKPGFGNKLEKWKGEGSERDVQMGGDMGKPTSWFMLMFARIEHNTVKQLFFN